MDTSIHAFFERKGPWQDCLLLLRDIVSEIPELSEQLKWGQASYTLGKANVVLIHAFKDYCALLFFKGALLSDPDGILVQQTEHVQSARQIRFFSAAQIRSQKSLIKKYLKEAVRVEASGAKVPKRNPAELKLPEELQDAMKQMPDFAQAFYALSPGRQRAYALHFADAKQSKTRVARIEKHLPEILKGKGLND